jgi:hypothetical protein
MRLAKTRWQLYLSTGHLRLQESLGAQKRQRNQQLKSPVFGVMLRPFGHSVFILAIFYDLCKSFVHRVWFRGRVTEQPHGSPAEHRGFTSFARGALALDTSHKSIRACHVAQSDHTTIKRCHYRGECSCAGFFLHPPPSCRLTLGSLKQGTGGIYNPAVAAAGINQLWDDLSNPPIL